MTNIINITNTIKDYECYDPDYGPVVISLGDNIETALDTALLADDYCSPTNTCSYFERILTPFGTDEAQCEFDQWLETQCEFDQRFDEDLPF